MCCPAPPTDGSIPSLETEFLGAEPELAPMSGRAVPFDEGLVLFLTRTSSDWALLFEDLLVARFNSSSVTSMYCWPLLEQTSLILATKGSLRLALSWSIMLIMRCLKGIPLWSREFTLQISTMSLRAFCLTLVFL